MRLSKKSFDAQLFIKEKKKKKNVFINFGEMKSLLSYKKKSHSGTKLISKFNM